MDWPDQEYQALVTEIERLRTENAGLKRAVTSAGVMLSQGFSKKAVEVHLQAALKALARREG